MTMKIVVLAAVLAMCIAGSNATLGVDVSQYVSESNWACLNRTGFHFAVVRAYRSTGSPDPNARSTIENAWKGGMAHVDAYMFPCPKCGNPEGQVRSMVDNLSGVSYGMIWLDIEGPQYWMDSTSENQAFMEGLVKEAQNHKRVGIYSSASQWHPIFGDSWGPYSHLPLWCPRYDGRASRQSGFIPFAGWTLGGDAPAIKQYEGDRTECGVGVDLNVY